MIGSRQDLQYFDKPRRQPEALPLPASLGTPAFVSFLSQRGPRTSVTSWTSV
jgi:hypothetical protein